MQALSLHHLNYKIRLTRIQKRLTLRELADITSLSHGYINRIEQGLLTPSEETLNVLQEALGFQYQTNLEAYDRFYEVYEQLYRCLLYVHYNKAEKLVSELLEHRDIHENSACFIDYYLILFSALQHLPTYPELNEDLHEKLKILLPVFSYEQKALFLLESGIYSFYQENNSALALEQLALHAAFSNDSNQLGLNYYVTGFIYSLDYRKYKDSLKAYSKAQNYFQDQNNFIRVMYVKSNKQTLCIDMHRYEEFIETNQETMRYAEFKGLVSIYKTSMKNLGKYYIARGEYAEALDIFSHYNDPSEGDYYFLKAYTLYNLGYSVEALAICDTFKKTPINDRDGLYALGMDCIEALIKGDDSKRVNVLLQQFIDRGFEIKYYFFIRIAFKLIKNALPAARQYKEAYIYAHRVLEAIKHICGKEDIYEILSESFNI